tara:strand:- start:9260 stop:9955 length:696 start_codon:yes stop_codon:yes gene_type:complete
MATFFDPPESKEHIFAPFGPPIGYLKLSDEFIQEANQQMDSNIADLEDFSDNLVGKVTQEVLFNEAIKNSFLKEAKNFVGRYAQWAEVRNSMGKRRLNTVSNTYGVEVVSGWIVRQFENEYNPLHIHTNCRLSCVGYLKLPDDIDKEWEEDYADHHPSHGHIQFAHGTPSHWNMTNFMIRPRVGDFYLFPSDMFHCVYPFKTKGERRSFSVNINFLEKPKDTGAIENETGT